MAAINRYLIRAKEVQSQAIIKFKPGITLVATFRSPGYHDLERYIRYVNPIDIPRKIENPSQRPLRTWFLDYVETLAEAEQIKHAEWQINQEKPNPFPFT